MSAGQAALGGAATTANTAADYFRKLMSGNRAAVTGAVAPAANAALEQEDARRRQLAASGTARGGGTAAINQQTKDSTLARIQNMLFGARTAGATGTLEAARTQGQIGVAEAGTGTNLASIGGNAITNLGILGTTARGQQLQQDNALGASAGELAAALLFA